MKWNHQFTLTEKGDAYRIYNSENIEARLDFFNHILRVAIYKKGERLFPTYSICPGESKMSRHGRDRLSVEGLEPLPQKDKIIIDDVEIYIDITNLRITYKKGGKVLFSDRDIIAYNFDGELGQGSYHYLSREDNEEIFGLGDKTGPINKNKQHYKIETFDAMGFNANSSDPLYKQVPFYICRNSVGSYGIFYDTYSNGEMDFGKEINNYYEHYKWARFEEDALVYYVIFGSVEEIVRRFSHLTGKANLPPRWSFRYCGSTMTYTDADNADEQLRGFLKLIKKYNIDCGGFYLSSGYTQIGDKRYVFHWNKDKIPNPKDLADTFLKEGLHFLPNIKPAFLNDHPLYESIAKKGWFLHYQNGEPALFLFWGGVASYLDFTNDDAYEFWTECVKKNLVDYGYNSIWNDNNEYDIHDEEVYACGFGHEVKAKLIRPLFSLLMSMASFEAVDHSKRVMSVSRSGLAGHERIAQTWTGDNYTSFEDFRGNHKMAMSMALSGYHLFGQDIGGFAGPSPSRELFIRWIQYGLFTPRFTLHSWKADGKVTMPWLYEDLIPVVQKLFNFRKSLVPYLFSEANKSIEEYAPLIYPIFLKNSNFAVESDNFMCGSAILSCPVFDEGVREIEVDLPEVEDGWYYQDQLLSGKVKVESKLDDIPPYFVKAGSIVPLDENGLTFHIYSKEKGQISYKFYNDDSPKNDYQLVTVDFLSDKVVVKGLAKDSKIILHDKKARKLQLTD